jgi:mono/diheme cytochrome c family protein
MSKLLFVPVLLAASFWGAMRVQGAESPIDRGHYLVTIAGCSDCHTPGAMQGKPDLGRFLAGSEVGFDIPGLGVFVGSNLTPDPETGLGKWSDDEIVAAVTTGLRPDGRRLAPAMPWQGLSKLTTTDARAIVAYLRSLPPVRNAASGPFGPSETPTTLVLTLMPGEVHATMRKAPR